MRYRRNSAVSLTVADVRAMVAGAGLSNLAALLQNDAMAEAFVTRVNALVAKVSAEKAAASAAEAERAAAEERSRAAAAEAERARDVTDREGWTLLAQLVTASVLPSLSEEERSALRAAFLEEAEKAAA